MGFDQKLKDPLGGLAGASLPIHAQWCASRAADFYCKIQLKLKLSRLIQLNNPLSLINFSAGLRPSTGKDSQEIP